MIIKRINLYFDIVEKLHLKEGKKSENEKMEKMKNYTAE
jgi:hypothetical protein